MVKTVIIVIAVLVALKLVFNLVPQLRGLAQFV